MNEPNDNQSDQPIAEQSPPDETQVEYRDISEEELKQILEGHKKWLESDGKEGKLADLSRSNLKDAILDGVNLQEAFLGGANLTEAILRNANLKKASFENATLVEASLEGVNFKGANLYKAEMQKTVLDGVKGLSETNLKYTNLEGATGLLGNEFAQADVTGAKLPGDIKEFKALETVKETSQNARKIFFAMLLGCVYSWLTIATTTDVRLLTNTASSPLPIIGTEIPIAWFYIAAPLVLICLYFYFHLYLLKLWEGLSGLPANVFFILCF